MKTPLILVCSNVEAMMHGVSRFYFSGRKGRECTAVYTDGTKESATIPEVLAVAMRNYYVYQCENGVPADAPNTFALVSAIQSKRSVNLTA